MKYLTVLACVTVVCLFAAGGVIYWREGPGLRRGNAKYDAGHFLVSLRTENEKALSSHLGQAAVPHEEVASFLMRNMGALLKVDPETLAPEMSRVNDGHLATFRISDGVLMHFWSATGDFWFFHSFTEKPRGP